mgnify:CR=1 FL=1
MVDPVPALKSFAAVLCFLALVPSATAQIRVIGDDNRQMVDLAEPPWVSIGRVNRGGRAFCTGVLIAPDKVLTAAHCLYDTAQGQWAPASAIHFVAGYARGEYAAESGAAGCASRCANSGARKALISSLMAAKEKPAIRPRRSSRSTKARW